MFRVQRVAVAPPQEFSPHIKLLLFFTYLAVTFATVKLWMVIIEEENVYYETAAAFATILLLTTLLWFYFYLVRKHNERIEEFQRRNNPISSPVSNNTAIETIHRRILMRRAYGNNVDFFMEGGAGLSAEIIDNLLQHSIYNSDGSCKSSPKSDCHGDVELGCFVEDKPGDTPAAATTACCSHHHECAVCLTDFLTGDNITELPCGHSYHRACITSWLLSRNICPMCKQLAVPADLLDASLESQLAAQAAADLEIATPRSVRTFSNTTQLEQNRLPVLGHQIEDISNSNSGADAAGQQGAVTSHNRDTSSSSSSGHGRGLLASMYRAMQERHTGSLGPATVLPVASAADAPV